MTDTDLLQQIEDLKEELRKVRLDRTRLKRQVDTLSQENKELRTLNMEYTKLIENRPTSRSKLQETIRVQAGQINTLQHELEMQRITNQYSKPDKDDKRVSDIESKMKLLQAENDALREDLTKQVQAIESENTNLRNDFTEKVKSLEDENAELRAELQRYSFTDEQLRPAKRGRPRTVPKATRQQVKDLRSQGHSVRKIAELLHVSNGFIMKVLKET